jgi:excisionase family DNA binding protein
MQIVYTMHSLARLLQVSTRTLRREIDEGKLPFVKIRGRLRFRQEDVEQYLRDCTTMDSQTGARAAERDEESSVKAWAKAGK